MVCTTCGTPRAGEWCSEDGGELTPRRQKNAGVVAATPAPGSSFIAVSHQPNGSTAPASRPPLTLVNRNLGLSLPIIHDSILGRVAGPYAQQLEKLSKISGKHLHLTCNEAGEWLVTDLGSTNKTKYNHVGDAWQTVAEMPLHTPRKLQNGWFLLIANVEFEVKIESAFSPAATERL